jgi:hypothetical protein
MKLHTTILVALAANKETEAFNFTGAWNNFFYGTPTGTTAAPTTTETMPTQPVTQPTQAPFVQPVQNYVYQTANCADRFSRCGNWATQCNNKNIKSLCAKTCGLCGTGQIVQQVPVVQPVQVIQPAPPAPIVQQVAPVVQAVQAAPVPVVAKPMFVNPYGNVNQQIYSQGCYDTFSRCSQYLNQCGNTAIRQMCKRSCNLCGQQPSLIQQIQPVVAQVQAVVQPAAPLVPLVQVQGTHQAGTHGGIDHSGACIDRFSRCSSWKSECHNASLQKLCMRTCGLCDKPAFPFAPTPPVMDAKKNFHFLFGLILTPKIKD